MVIPVIAGAMLVATGFYLARVEPGSDYVPFGWLLMAVGALSIVGTVIVERRRDR